jgi:hypothetical protein
MTYSNSYVLAVKNSKRETLREYEGKIYLPFYSEYSLFLKNNHNVRCMCDVKIDGTDVLGGQRLVIPANSNINLERFLVNGDMNKGR